MIFARALTLLATVIFVAATFAEEPASKPASKPSGTVISAGDKDAIMANVDKEVTVEGTVSRSSWSGSGSVLFINFKDAAESQFSAVAFKKDREKFDAAFDGDAARNLTGAKVQVTGKIEMYKGRQGAEKPEIKLSSPDQIKVIEKAEKSDKPADKE